MLFLEIKDLPWKGKEVTSFPSVVTNTIAELANETYQYDGASISISVDNMDAVNRIVAAINMSRSSNEYGVIRTEGEVVVVARLAAQPIQPAPVQPVPVQQAPVAQQPMQQAPVQQAIRYPVVVQRSNEINPKIRDINQVLNRQAIKDEDLEKHLFSLKNSNSSALVSELARRLEEYNTYVRNMTATMRRINELSASTTGDEAVKSVIAQVRKISQEMPGNKIEDVFITANYIVFKTVPIRALNARTNQYHNIGRVAITVPIATMVGTDTVPLHFQPLDFVMKGSVSNTSYLLPHVSGHGEYCYGNATEAFIEAVVKRDLICLVDVAIRFLENPNTGDPMGIVINNWPIAEA